MSAFTDQLDVMVGKLSAAGLPATRRPDAVPPFVLVDAPAVATGDHASWATDVPVRCVVAPPADVAALDALLEMVQTVLVTLGTAPTFPAPYLTTGGKELPAYTSTYRVDVPNPNC